MLTLYWKVDGQRIRLLLSRKLCETYRSFRGLFFLVSWRHFTSETTAL